MPSDLAILVTLIAYAIALVAIGVACGQRAHDGVDYFLGGRRLGPIVSSISASASSSSAWTLLGVSGYAFAYGLSAIWLLPACVGGFALNWIFLAPGLRRLSHGTGAVTSTDVLAAETRGAHRHVIVAIASAIILVSLATYVASQFQGAGKALAGTFGLAPSTAIVLGSALVVFYTLIGGFWAVSITDTIQGLVMAATSVILPVAALVAIGPASLLEGMRQVAVEGYASPWRDLTRPAALGMVAGLLGIGLGYPGQPHVVNRLMALRQGSTTIHVARAVAIAWAVVVYSGMILLGLCARVGFAGIEDGEAAFMRVATDLFHPALAGVMIAAVLSAVMSTADSQLLVAASAVTHDLGLGGADRRTMIRRSRLVVLGLSGGAVAAALLVEETIFSRVLFAWSSMGCAFGPLLLVTVLRGPVRPGATIASMLLGFTLSVGAYAARQADLIEAWSGVFERVLPFAVALVVAWAGARRTESS